MEIWKPIFGYEVSDMGRVRNTKGEVLQQKMDKKGYLLVTLRDSPGDRSVYRVHRLVLEAFHGAAPGYQCCHWDDVPTNNVLSNLRWGGSLDNHADRRRNEAANGGKKPKVVLVEAPYLNSKGFRRWKSTYYLKW